MKAVISSTNESQYSFFIPITTWLWNKLNIDVILFVPHNPNPATLFAMCEINKDRSNRNSSYGLIAPEHKMATYSQCVRLYGACLDLPEDEVLITSDIDMAVFKLPEYNGGMQVFGYDLVPQGQYPMCYLTASVKIWREVFNLNKSYQEHLDDILKNIEAEHFRGNFWSKDQETAYQKISSITAEMVLIERAKSGTQFASKRYDRDDAYLLERLNPDTIDYHLPRPGYEENNFNQILTVLKYHYPNENFQWLMDYREQYLKLINS